MANSSPLTYMRGEIKSLEKVLEERLPHTKTEDDLSALGKDLIEICDSISNHLEKMRPCRSLSCYAGCDHCCHNLIETNPLFACVAFTYAQRHLPAEKWHIVQERLKVKYSVCPFVFDGLCSIYEARPLVCRGYYSRDFTLCQKGVYCEQDLGYQGDDADAAHQSMIFLYVLEQRIGAAQSALGIDARSVFLHEALRTLFANPNAAEAWLQGKSVFSQGSPSTRS